MEVFEAIRRDRRRGVSVVDLLTFGGNIIETGTGSYRLAHAHRRTSPWPQDDAGYWLAERSAR